MAPGLNTNLGYRFESGLRLEAGLGSAFVIGGMYLGAGYAFTALEGASYRLEVPVLLNGVVWGTKNHSDEEEGYVQRESQWGGAATGGVDFLLRKPDWWLGLAVSLRGGFMLLQERDARIDELTPWPVGQAGVGFTF